MSLGGNDQDKNIEDSSSLHDRIFQGGQKAESLFSYARIHRVPGDLRELNKSAYTPRLIAIGPLHRDVEQHQKSMRDVKMVYTYHLLDRAAKGKEDNRKELSEKRREVLQECEKKMKDKDFVDSAKKHYAEEIYLNDNQMAEMMLVDGCFILELLYVCYRDKKTKEAAKITAKGGDSRNSKASRSSGSSEQPKGFCEKRKLDPILDNILIANIIKHDLLLFENQIPFFVLEDLFKLTVDEFPDDDKILEGKKLSLTEYVISYFSDILSPEGNNSGREKKTGCCSPSFCCLPSDCHVLWVCGSAKENEQEIKEPMKANHEYDHILHLLHDYYGPGGQWGDKQNSAKISNKFSALEVRASQLDHGGVKFVPVEGNNLFHIKFTEPRGIRWWFYRATFEIPTVVINDVTEPFLRNLIAFEQFCPGVPPYFTSYANLMDVLINSEKDVEVLSKANVIRNFSGTDEDVSKLLNKLCKEVVAGFFFEESCQQAFEYSKRCWPRYMAYWRRTYFAAPWAFKGVCLVLILFFIQVANFVRMSLHKRF